MSGQDRSRSAAALPVHARRDHLPTFLIGGARKAGTTALWRFLDAHPDVGMAAIKEPRFFTRQRGRTDGALDPAPPASGNFDRGWTWYTELFAGHEHKVARGEASTMYLNAPDAADLIASCMPSMRLIFCLRHPVERMYSNYWFERRYEDLPSFERLLADNHARMQWYADQSHYARHLEGWRRALSDDQILIVLSDDIQQRQDHTLRRVCDFIGVDVDRLPPRRASRHNTASSLRSPRLHRVLARHRGDWTRILPRVAVGPARRVKGWVLRHNTKATEYPPLPPALRASLAKEFDADTACIERLTGRDLSSWRR